MDESSGEGHSEGHSMTNVRRERCIGDTSICLNLCPDIDSTLVGVFKIYSIWIIVKLCKRTGPFLALSNEIQTLNLHMKIDLFWAQNGPLVS